MTKHNFLRLLGKKKAGKTTIFLRNTKNYVHRRIYIEYARRIFERAMTIFGHCHNVLNNNDTCYIPRLSLNKTSTVIGCFFVTWP